MAWKLVRVVASDWTDAVTAIEILILVAYSVIQEWEEIPLENLRVDVAIAILDCNVVPPQGHRIL
ncbi:MAG: hypothetical protein AAGJ40_21805 [Planctomycetota bacterium]